jgi:hypothetical protein
MPGLLELIGAQPKGKPTPFVPLFIEDLWTGLYTNRTALHDPSNIYERRYFGGRPGTLIGGLNVEVSVRNTIIRRYGLSAFSNATYSTLPTRGYSFEDTNGVIRVLIDTGSTPSFVLSQVGNASAGSATYTGTITGGASNAFAGLVFQVTGFSNNYNNGTFTCTASTALTLVLSNGQALAETHAGAAISAGAVYYDEQNGSKILLKAKQPGAGQSHFQAVAGICYVGDGVDTWMYTPDNSNGTIWAWGIDAPTAQPSVTIVPSGSASPAWQASTIFSTMGLLVDANGNMQQLVSVNSSGTNTTQFGTSANGEPNWNQTPGGTTSDNTITWTNFGPIVLWTAHTTYNNASIGGTAVNPCIIYDPNTKACFINANPGNASGVSGSIYPQFKNAPGFSIHDGGVKWFALPNLPASWKKSTVYPKLGSVSNNDQGSGIVEPFNLANGLPTSQTVYWQTSGGGTSAASATAPPWATSAGLQTTDGDLIYLCLGSATWAATTNYSGWSQQGTVFSALSDGTNFQVCVTTGTSATVAPGTSFTLTAAANAVSGDTTYTGTFSPTIPTGRAVVITGFTNSANNGTFQVISCSATQLVVNNPNGASESHAGSAQYNPWATSYGAQTKDGSAVWVCVGAASPSWAASTKWNLPINGFAPPSSSQPYGGSSVVDSNTDVEFVISSGKSSSSAPSWQAIGSKTTDNGITWYNLEAFSANSISWTEGHVYAYSLKARALDDFYSIIDPTTNALPIPPGLANALPAPTGSLTGGISTASPVYTITGADTGAVNTISGLGSTNPAVDTIVIWRDADGGGSDNMFELTEIPAPPPINGLAQPWTFQDYLPDTPTSVFPGLDELNPAPIDDANDPPPSTALPMDYNFERIWCADGQQVIFSGGPDTQVGNPQECFAPADEFPFLSNVVRAAKSTQGLITYTTNSIEIILGGPATASFYSVTLAPGIGLGNFNAMDFYAGEQFFMDTTGQLRVLSPSLSLTSAGFPITDQLVKFNPKTAYITFHEQPNDSAIYIATGSTTYNGNTGWFRVNPRQIPGSINGPEPVVSPFAAITNGCQMVQSVEVSPGVKKLLVGSAVVNSSILMRDTTVFTDNGTQYDANFQLGSLWLAHRGECAILSFVECDFSSSTNPTVSYLLNEVSGTFTNFVTADALYDPPFIYGNAGAAPSSYVPLRFYFSDTGLLAKTVHMQVGVDFGTTSNSDEIFDLTIYGGILKSK